MNQPTETSATTPRFVRVAIDDDRLRFYVIDLNCLDTVCECRGPADADAITEVLNAQGDKFPPRLKIEFGTMKEWEKPKWEGTAHGSTVKSIGNPT